MYSVCPTNALPLSDNGRGYYAANFPAATLAEGERNGQRALVLGVGGHDATAWELGVITGMAEAGVDGRDAIIYEQISLSIFPKRVFQHAYC